jgi:hypothetical protein
MTLHNATGVRCSSDLEEAWGFEMAFEMAVGRQGSLVQESRRGPVSTIII